MPLYKHDIFISYCHKDNPQDEGQKGWISNFHSALARRLKELGLDPKIWRDETEIRGHDYFASVTLNKLRKTKILITILTPNYIHSQWCTDERQEFCKALQNLKDVCAGYQSRIFKIIKIPVPLEEQPAEIRSLIGYEFYKIDEKGYSIELTRDPNSPYFNDYIKKLNYVAHDIVSLLDTINKKRHLSCHQRKRQFTSPKPHPAGKRTGKVFVVILRTKAILSFQTYNFHFAWKMAMLGILFVIFSSIVKSPSI